MPGWIPPSVGLLDLSALTYAEDIDEISTVVLVDRNLASRMARLATEGTPRRWDYPTEVAINLMAFAQAMNLDIEPGLAFHELASSVGNASAQGELSWFRAADRGAATKWIDIAMRRCHKIDLGPIAPLEPHDLVRPLKRWRRNYIVSLKMARLTLEVGRQPPAMFALLDWMIDDFIFAGPAAVYAARHFGPTVRAGKMMKQLRAEDRERAIAGARNAAWDITYLSEFLRLVAQREHTNQQYVFATADRALRETASALFCGSTATEDYPGQAEILAQWWPEKFAQQIADKFFQCFEVAGSGRNRGADLSGDPIAEMIAEGEAWLREWQAP